MVYSVTPNPWIQRQSAIFVVGLQKDSIRVRGGLVLRGCQSALRQPCALVGRRERTAPDHPGWLPVPPELWPAAFRPRHEREHDAAKASDEIDPRCRLQSEKTRANNTEYNLDDRNRDPKLH